MVVKALRNSPWTGCIGFCNVQGLLGSKRNFKIIEILSKPSPVFPISPKSFKPSELPKCWSKLISNSDFGHEIKQGTRISEDEVPFAISESQERIAVVAINILQGLSVPCCLGEEFFRWMSKQVRPLKTALLPLYPISTTRTSPFSFLFFQDWRSGNGWGP